MSEDNHKEKFSLVWDKKGDLRKQTWEELKTGIYSTKGGLGILADDFVQLLQFYPAPFHYQNSMYQKAFSELIEEATSDVDIELLAKVLSIMLIEPDARKIEGGWFIAGVLTKNGEDFDSERATLIINQLYILNNHATQVLCKTLTNFVHKYSDTLTIMDRIRNSNKLNHDVMLLITPAKIFISYAKEDNQLAERLLDDLQKAGFKVWKDTHDLLPGEQWEDKIKRSLKEHDFVILCLSQKAIAKTGFFQVEIKEALKWQQYRSEYQIYTIPVRLDECEVPSAIEHLQYTDLFPNWDDGVKKIVTAINKYRKWMSFK